MLIGGTCTLLAQKAEFGIKGGFNLQNIELKNFDGQQFIDEVYSPKRNLGYHLGLFAKLQAGPVFIQPEALFTQVRSKFIATNANNQDKKVTLSFNRFDLPILVGLAAGPISIMTGPVLSFPLSEQQAVFNNSLTDGSFGFQAAFQIDLKKYRVGMRYEGAFSNTAKSVEIQNRTYQTDARTDQVIVYIAINFLQGK